MKLPISDYLHNRGWDRIRVDSRPGGHAAIIWKNRRTGEELPQGKAKEVQRQRDMKEKYGND